MWKQLQNMKMLTLFISPASELLLLLLPLGDEFTSMEDNVSGTGIQLIYIMARYFPCVLYAS